MTTENNAKPTLFDVRFTGRTYGAIGAFGGHYFQRTANSREELLETLYAEKGYDFLRTPSITPASEK